MKPMTLDELLTADIAVLSVEDLKRRQAIIELRKTERELDLVEAQNLVHEDAKREAARKAKHRTEDIRNASERVRREQSGCKHRSGGKDYSGFFNGDGKQGYSVATQRLPTGEVYFLCFRCQKEWRLPSKRDVVEGRLKLSEYEAQLAEYHLAGSWDKTLFSCDGGDIPGSVQFRIPALEAQQAQDDLDFANYLANLKRAN